MLETKYKNMDEISKFAYEGNLELLKMKIKEDRNLATKIDSAERMPLHWAASGGHTDIVEFLLNTLNVPVDARDEANWTPLMIAASAGRNQIVADLLAHNAQVNAVNSTGQCPLHYAASKDRYEVYKKPSAGEVSESAYVRDRFKGMIAEKLLENGADANIGDCYENTPLHRAASQGHVKMVKLLLQYNVDVNYKDKQGNTPLHLACEEERAEMCKLLIDRGAYVTILNKEEKTPLDFAPPTLKKTLQIHSEQVQIIPTDR